MAGELKYLSSVLSRGAARYPQGAGLGRVEFYAVSSANADFAVHLDSRFLMMTNAAVMRVARNIRDGIREEFEAGTDKDGASHSKTGESLNTLKITYGPNVAKISMSGGAFFVEYRQPPHIIEAKSPNGYLFWEDADHPVHEVVHPGYEGDKFFERGIEKGLRMRVVDQALFKGLMEPGKSHDWFGPGPAMS